MTASSAALIVSITSAGITLSGIIWQFALYRLSGARLRVQLVFEFSEGAAVLSVAGTKRRSRESFAEALNRDAPAPFGIECVRVRVTNVGRSPVSVENIALDLGRMKWWRRGRKTLVPSRFKNSIYGDLPAAERTAVPVRLEVGDVTSMVFHLWPALSSSINELGRGKHLKVRATAQAAGRRPTLSPRRVAWRFQHREDTWFTDQKVTPELRVYRELWYQSYIDYVGGLPLAMHRQVSDKLRAGASVADIKAYLDELHPDGIYHMTAYQVHEAFHAVTDMDKELEASPPESSTLDATLGEGTEPKVAENSTKMD